MNNDKALNEEWTLIEQEHVHLHTLFAKLEGAVDRPGALTALDELEKWLLHHFVREERPEGLLRAISGDKVNVQAVVDEHAAIRDVIEETRRLLESAEESALGNELVQQVTAELGANLRSHEQHERALIQRHFGDDGQAGGLSSA